MIEKQVLSMKKGIEIAITAEGNILVGGKPPQYETEVLNNGKMALLQVSSTVPKHIKPKMVRGSRRRKQALQKSVKYFRISFSYTKVFPEVNV